MSSENKQSWNSAMNDWSRRETLSWKFWNKVVRPHHTLSPSKKIIGWMWRAAVLILLPLLLLKYFVSGSLEGDSFTADLSKSLKRELRAESVSIPKKIGWGRRGAKIPKLIIKWGEKSEVEELQLYNIGLSELTQMRAIGGNWHTDLVTISRVELLFRGAGIERLIKEDEIEIQDGTEVESESAAEYQGKNSSTVYAELYRGLRKLGLASFATSFIAPRDHQMLSAGIVSPPSIGRLKAGGLRVLELNMYWGDDATRKGQVTGSEVSVRNFGGTWNGMIKGGLVSQNWVTRLPLKKAKVEWNGKDLLVSDGEFDIESDEASTFTVAARLHRGQMPLKFEADLIEAPVKHFVHGPHRKYFSGKVDGKIAVNGDVLSEKSVKAVADFQTGGAYFKGQPFFTLMSHMTHNTNFSRMPFSGGQVHLETEGGNISNIRYNLICRDLLRLEGEAAYKDKFFDGMLNMGCEHHVFRLIPEIQKKHFTEEVEEAYWKRMKFYGALEQLFAKELEEVEADYRTLYAEEYLKNKERNGG